MLTAKRNLLLALIFQIASLSLVFGQDAAKTQYSGHVNDFANVLSPSSKGELEKILTDFEQRSGAQIGVAVVTTTGEKAIEEYATDLYRSWGIGARAGQDKDKGALLVVATQDRKSRLEVGYGLEGDLPDGLAGELLRRMRPYFQQQRWDEGVTVGVRTVVDTLSQKWNLSATDQKFAYSPSPSQEQVEIKPRTVLFIAIVVVLIFLLLAWLGRRGGGGPRGGIGWWAAPIIFHQGGGGFGGSSWGSTGGWSDSGGSSDSGWGGFGGGSSGGGGASDSW